jgi:hypothetical protein
MSAYVSEAQNESAERDERRVLTFIAKHGHVRDVVLTSDAFEVPLHREAFNWLRKFAPCCTMPGHPVARAHVRRAG